MRRSLILPLLFACALTGTVSAQSYRGTVNEGNERYRAKEYDAAREQYEKAATADPERPESYFNAGNAAYRLDDIKTALAEYEKAGLRLTSPQQIAATLYNAGNVFLNAAEKGTENPVLRQSAGAQEGNATADDGRMEGYRQAIDFYKKSLKLNPENQEARYNLTYARKKLEELRKQQQDQKQDKNQQQKQDKDQQQKQNKQDQQQQDNNKQQDQQKNDQQKKDQQDQQQNQKSEQQEKAKPEQQQQPQPQPEREQQISKQQAEQILRALQREEKDLQKKKRQQQQGRRISVEKDW